MCVSTGLVVGVGRPEVHARHFFPIHPTWLSSLHQGASLPCCAGKLQGFGFVQFATPAAVEAALRMSGAALMGRELTVDAASAYGGGGAPPTVTGEPVEGCWFCLSNPNADVNLVASIGARKTLLRHQCSCMLFGFLDLSVLGRESCCNEANCKKTGKVEKLVLSHQLSISRDEPCCLDLLP